MAGASGRNSTDRMQLIDRVAAEGRRTGRWIAAANWLASALNDMVHASPARRVLDLEERLDMGEIVSRHVAAVEGDQREPDVITLPDGSRVCWHLGRWPRDTQWVVESPGEPCGYGRS